MKKFAVIVAGGSGSRMGEGIPKQFRTLNGRPLLWWSLKAFHDEDKDTTLILVLPEAFINLWHDCFESMPEIDRIPHLVAPGGDNRTQSVINGLCVVDEENSLVAVHDAARPLVTMTMIAEGWKTAETHGAAVPVVPVTDSLREIDGSGSRSVPRSNFVAVQTPQVFKTSLLKEAYNHLSGNSFTDDASAIEDYGHPVTLFEGSPDNMKVTNPNDLEIAAILMDRNG